MRCLLTGVLLIPVLALAEPVKIEKPVLCENTKLVFDSFVKSEFKEIPMWIGEGTTSKFTLLVNEKTKTWTLIEFNKEIACVVGFGEDYKTISTGLTI